MGMRDDPIYDEQHRAVHLMNQRVARGGPPQHVTGPPQDPGFHIGQRKVRFDPRLAQTPTSNYSAKPGPEGMTKNVTGSGPGHISRKNDPTNKYKDIEKQSGSPDKSAVEYDGIKHLVRLIIVALFVGAIFVVPQEYRPFWIILTTLFVLCGIGFALYLEWDAKAFSEGTDEAEADRAKGWAGTMLYMLTMATTAVTVGVLMVMVWKIYSVTKANSNLLGWRSSGTEETGMHDPSSPEGYDDSYAAQQTTASPMPPPHYESAPPVLYERHRKKHKRRHRY